MILNVSGRSDIPAFYSEWFFNRYHAGYVDVRNPFNPKMVSRIHFENVDAILFCSKNPLPMIDRIHIIKEPVIFHVTLTPYRKEIEPNLPDKKEIIEGIKKLSQILGKDKVVVRYDPVFLSETYNIEYHLKAFERVCSLLEGHIETIIISFIDEYKNVQRHQGILQKREFAEDDYRRIGLGFSQSAKNHGMKVQTCYEERNLAEYGFYIGECMSKEIAYALTGKAFKDEWRARKERKCHCVAMVDIGAYNTCRHLCRYCYANFDEKIIQKNISQHDPNSSLLIGHLQPDDVIKERIK